MEDINDKFLEACIILFLFNIEQNNIAVYKKCKPYLLLKSQIT